MATKRPLIEVLLRGPHTMLGQVRSLFLGFLLIWPLFGLWGVDADTGRAELAIVAAIVVEVWLYAGYRRQKFPVWSWIFEGVLVAVVASASNYGATIGLCFMWVNFRALYGAVRDKILAGAVLTAIMTAGIMIFGTSPGETIPLLFTALLSLSVNHVLAMGCRARDRSAERESAMASAGAGLAASGSRPEAMEVTLGAALAMDSEVSAALIFTVAGPALHVVAVTGDVGDEAAGWITELDELPPAARKALQPGGYAVVDGEAAVQAVRALRLPGYAAVAMAPLTAHDYVFGMLVLALHRRPADDLSAALTTLAGEAALTLDQLLTRSRLSIVVDHSPDALMLASEAGTIRSANPAAVAMLNRSSADLIGFNLWSLVHPEDRGALSAQGAGGVTSPQPCRWRGHEQDAWTEVEATLEIANENDGTRSMVFNARDISERQRLELELRHAQKLESVGRLAAGIAHEINTPIQFVGDNVRFLETAFTDFGRLYAAYGELVAAARDVGALSALVTQVDEVAADIDVDFIMDETPPAISQTLDGIARVAGIVRAMKAFGHPGTDEKIQADLNEAIGHTLVVANNEIKYVADVETHLGDLPLVLCHLGDINQVVLNLVVNAAHAIAAADRGRGTVRVSTRVEERYAVIEVADTGTGVPPEIADKLFDPFFTTKEVGTGTGQGLALVRTLVTDRHGGTIGFTSEVGTGTIFTVRLPLASNDEAASDDILTAVAP